MYDLENRLSSVAGGASMTLAYDPLKITLPKPAAAQEQKIKIAAQD